MDSTETMDAPKRRSTRKKRAEKAAGAKPRGRKKAAAIPEADELNLLVEFGGVSIGDGTGRLGVKVSRQQLTLAKADRTLCGRRLTGRVVLTPGGEDPDQQHLFEGTKRQINATFDVKRFGVAPDC